MTRYYRVTALLHEDEMAFVKEVADAFKCSIAKAISVCVIWARNNKSLIEVIKQVKEAEKKWGTKEESGS